MSVAFPRAGSPAAALARAVQGTTSEETIIKRIADGDRLAMRALFARHRVPLYRFVLRMVRDPALSEDILSDVFLDVWRQAQRFEARSAVATWLLGIARFKALSALRRRTDADLDDEMLSTIVDSADDPELVLQKKHRAELLRRAVASLSPEQGEIIDLVYYHEKSVSEVAGIVGIPESTVKTRMFYARKRLAELVTAA
jgi:RNA polymerase sigma-70 factor (ECF subfamily)